jgi:hypothetical protein
VKYLANVIAAIFATCLFIMATPAHAGCTLDEVQKMVKSGSGKKVIEEQCDSEVDDLPRCPFSRVMSLALAKRSTSTIRDECGACDRPRCELQNGGGCWLGQTAPKGFRPGDACHCFTPMGPIVGELSCNN